MFFYDIAAALDKVTYYGSVNNTGPVRGCSPVVLDVPLKEIGFGTS